MSHPKGVEDRSGDHIYKDEAGSPTGRGQVQGTDVELHGPPNSVVNSMADWDGWAGYRCLQRKEEKGASVVCVQHEVGNVSASLLEINRLRNNRRFGEAQAGIY